MSHALPYHLSSLAFTPSLIFPRSLRGVKNLHDLYMYVSLLKKHLGIFGEDVGFLPPSYSTTSKKGGGGKKTTDSSDILMFYFIGAKWRILWAIRRFDIRNPLYNYYLRFNELTTLVLMCPDHSDAIAQGEQAKPTDNIHTISGISLVPLFFFRTKSWGYFLNIWFGSRLVFLHFKTRGSQGQLNGLRIVMSNLWAQAQQLVWFTS